MKTAVLLDCLWHKFPFELLQQPVTQTLELICNAVKGSGWQEYDAVSYGV
jgi:hypothetical protein